MEDRAYLSIGEVLSLLKEEFPDVTISKIRFLESQGLLDPERTPSGYRKFYETDVERLRWILRQQREHFLPLKVIKGRLRVGAEGAGDDGPDEAATEMAATDMATEMAADGSMATVERLSDSLGGQAAGAGSAAAGQAGQAGQTGQAGGLQTAEAGQAVASAQSGRSGGPAAGSGSSRVGTAGSTATPGAPTTVGGAGFPGSMGNYLDLPPLPVAQAGVSLTLSELSAATGLDDDLLKELEKFGLLSGRKVASSVYYDEDALNVGMLAAGFMKYGVEARHLRMYKTAGEREAGFFEQVVMPMLKQRNPQARRQATEALAELSQLGQGLRTAMLRQLLRHYFEG
ncbi:MAG: hypothetical protein QOI99_350 [Actinomycetota bacterium]|nr:hypothetical protein [Actinomycetota bacterium]